jgi:hypothetical protein
VVQGASVTWMQTYEGGFNDIVDFLIQTSDGGYLIAGNTEVGDEEIADFWIIKIDSAGNFQWNKTYARTNEHLGIGGITQTSDGGYAIAGKVSEMNLNQFIVLIKIDESGNILWNKEIGSGPTDLANALIETSDEGIALAGQTMGFANTPDFWLIKTDANGNMQWNQTYGGTNNEAASKIVETSDGGFALAGYTYSNPYNYNPWLIKTDQNGNIQWNQTYESTNQEITHNLAITSDFGYALAGVNITSPNFDYWLIITNQDGNLEWKHYYEGVNNGYIDHVGLVTAPDGGLAFAGSKGSWPEGIYTFLIKTDANGNMQWNQTYQSPEYDMDCSALIVTSDEGFALAGQTNYYQIFLIKTDEYGVIPEFTSTILVLILITTLSMVIIKKRQLQTKQN